MEGENKPQIISIGQELLRWQVDEYPRHQHSFRWYLLNAVLALALIIYAIFSANFLFAVIILMIVVIVIVSDMKEPERVEVAITNTGLAVGEKYFEYKNIKDFSVVYEPPKVKWLYVDFQSPWQPMLAIPLEKTDPNELRETLLHYLKENLERNEERLTDTLRRVYKL